MNIPTIGGARGIFEFFVPGVFLLLNLGFATYIFPFTDAETKNGIAAAVSMVLLMTTPLVVSGDQRSGERSRFGRTEPAQSRLHRGMNARKPRFVLTVVHEPHPCHAS